MTCRKKVMELCKMYGELSVLMEVQHYTRQHAVELDGELPRDAVVCRQLGDALDETFASAGRIQN